MNNEISKRNNGFALQPTNMDEAMKMAEMLSNSNIVPKNYKGQPGDTLVAMMQGCELGLNPIQSLQNIAVINGKPCVWGDALLALVQNHPSFGGIEETFDEKTMTATCVVWRKTGSRHTQTFSESDAEKAALWNKQGPWQNYPKRMLTMRARGFALRNTFADALLGLITAEEAYDYPQERDITAESSVVSQQTNGADTTPPELPAYPQDDFNINIQKWQYLIESGRKTADEIIATVGSKYKLSDDQRLAIVSIG